MPRKAKTDGLDEFHPDTTSNPPPVAVEVKPTGRARKAAQTPPDAPGRLDQRERFKGTGRVLQDRRKRFRE